MTIQMFLLLSDRTKMDVFPATNRMGVPKMKKMFQKTMFKTYCKNVEPRMKSFTKDDVMAYLEFIKNPEEREMIWNRAANTHNPKVVTWEGKDETHAEVFEDIMSRVIYDVHRHVEFHIVNPLMDSLRNGGVFADDKEETLRWAKEWEKWDWTREEKEQRLAEGKRF